jgi:hypothetical protein
MLRNPTASSDWARENAGRVRENQKLYYKLNREKRLLTNKIWRDNNLDKRKEYLRTYSKENSALMCYHTSKRKAIKLMATPGWSDHEKIAEFYRESDRLTKETGIKHNVDHVIPLVSPVVCGLHWEGNMQILSRRDNISKGNREWPDMSPMTPELQELIENFKQNSSNV